MKRSERELKACQVRSSRESIRLFKFAIELLLIRESPRKCGGGQPQAAHCQDGPILDIHELVIALSIRRSGTIQMISTITKGTQASQELKKVSRIAAA